MAEIVTLELPETLAQRAKEIAALTNRRIEDVLVEWIDRASQELPVESLPDDWVLALCDMQMEPEQQEALSELLERNREGQLDNKQVNQLNDLMQVYRSGLVRKARVLKVAVERGLRSALD